MYRPCLLSLSAMAMVAVQSPTQSAPRAHCNVTVGSMPTVVFTGDSQSCGRNLAIDFPQLLSRLLPARVINTAVGGSNSTALLAPMTGGTLSVKAGENVVYGKKVRWGMGPFPGMRITIDGEDYTIDHVDEHPPTRDTEIHLSEPARASYSGSAYAIEPGWRVRVAQWRPDVVCLMYINDGVMGTAAQDRWREMVRRIRALNAVPVLMSPVPVDDALHGGNHPGDNDRWSRNAAAVRGLAAELNCWFVDVFDLYWKLDPPLRGLVADGIHPDTDGSRLIVNGLGWVFEQMGLFGNPVFIKGSYAEDATAPLPQMIMDAAPFRISQPDHPDPDHQNEAGFTLAARLMNDDYALLAETDGHVLPMDRGVLLQVGLPSPPAQSRITLQIVGNGIEGAQVWLPQLSRWSTLPVERTTSGVVCRLRHDDSGTAEWHILILPEQAGAALDHIQFRVPGTSLPPWQPTGSPRPYQISSDHARPDNPIPNADFASDPIGWALSGHATVNSPSAVDVSGIAVPDSGKSRSICIPDSVPVRPYDLLDVQGSERQNDGHYRIRNRLTTSSYRVRRRPKNKEGELRGTLAHDHGCGFVPGGSCLDVRGDGEASVLVSLPNGTERIRTSLFHRVVDPDSLGTRDVPGRQARVEWTFIDLNGVPLAAASDAQLDGSYQWQKAEFSHTVPLGTASVKLSLATQSELLVQYTGIYLAPTGK